MKKIKEILELIFAIVAIILIVVVFVNRPTGYDDSITISELSKYFYLIIIASVFALTSITLATTKLIRRRKAGHVKISLLSLFLSLLSLPLFISLISIFLSLVWPTNHAFGNIDDIIVAGETEFHLTGHNIREANVRILSVTIKPDADDDFRLLVVEYPPEATGL